MRPHPGWTWSRPVLAALFVMLASCTADPVPVEPGTQATLAVRVDLSGTTIAMVTVEVTAIDIPAPLVFNLPTANGVASGTVTVPAGTARSISVRAYDSGGILTHSGSAVVNVLPGTSATLSITIAPLTGGVDITVTLGSMRVTVTPPSTILAPAATVLLAASIADANANPVPGTVVWATRNPGVATVDAAGLVTAVGPGATTIWATYLGASGSASITVTP